MNKGTASTWAQRYQARPDIPSGGTYDEKIHKAKDYDDFKKLVKKTFKEHQLGKSARLRLDALKQKNHSVDTYNEEFNTLAPDTGYDDNALRHLYIKGLNWQIADQIMLMENIPTDLYSLQDKATTFDLWRTNYFHWESQNEGQTNNYQGSGSRNNPIQINKAFIKRTQEELAQLKSENACFKCGKKGHIARNCWSGQRQGQGENRQYNQGGNHQQSSNPPKKNFRARIANLKELLAEATPKQFNNVMMDLREVQPTTEEKEDFWEVSYWQQIINQRTSQIYL
jgi:hypothetical protein